VVLADDARRRRAKLPEDAEMGKYRLPPVLGMLRAISVAVVIAAVTLPAFGRDLDGRYKDSPLRDWFEHLASGKVLCCSFADGYVVQDADWESRDGHYRVRVPKAADSDDGVWVDVPDEALITEPNKAGHTMVWPSYTHKGVSIRCFMPGSMT
jgi:hypothetical protein